MKVYFNLLPGQMYAVGPETGTQDIKDYPVSSLKSASSSFLGGEIAPVSAEDIGLALTEMLPVVSYTVKVYVCFNPVKPKRFQISWLSSYFTDCT
jgi:hypothetical protein